MRFYNIVFIFCLLSLFLFTSCLKENLSKGENKKVSISLNFNVFKKAAIKVSPADAAKALITIKKGGVELIYRKLFDVYHKADGVVISIELEDGDYTLEELVLGTMTLSSASGTYPKFKDAKYIAPKTKDDHKTAVPKGKLLPYSFKVSGAKASASGSSVGSTGVGSGDVSLELVPIVLVPAIPGTINPGFNPADVFTFGFKVVSGGVKVDDCIIKIIKQGEALPIHYGPATKKDGDGNPYFTFRKGNSKYSFEISKFGYATRYSLKMLDAADASMYNKSQTIELKKIGDPTIGNTKNVYVKSVSSNAGETPSEKLQRGGGDFGSTSYWDYLADNNGGFFSINQSKLINDTAIISSKYKVVKGDYRLNINVYGSPSANTIFFVRVGDTTTYFKKYSSSSGDGSSVSKAYQLPAIATSENIDFGSLEEGKISFGVYPSSQKSKVSFKLEQLERYFESDEELITKWTGGWRDDDAYNAIIDQSTGKIEIDVNSADFETKVTLLYPSATISPDPNTVTDWTKEVPFVVSHGGETRTYNVKVTVNKLDIIKVYNGTIKGTMNSEINKYGNKGNYNHLDVNSVSSMQQLFRYKYSFNGDISKWDVSNVKNMQFMFYKAKVFNDTLKYWDVSNVTNMRQMFRSAEKFNHPLNDWDVSNVTDMSSMFDGASSFNKPLNRWNVSNVKYMYSIFSYAKAFNQNINDWDVSSVLTMSGFFKGTEVFNQPLNKWNMKSVIYIEEMFAETKAFDQDIQAWDLSNVRKISKLFAGAEAFNQPLNNLKFPSKVRDIYRMFYKTKVFNQPLDKWDVSNVTNMGQMFRESKAFNQSLNNWKVSNVRDMHHMFFEAEKFNQPLNGWNVSKITNMIYMFAYTKKFNQPLNKWNVSNVTDMKYMFYESKAFNQNINDWVVSNVKDMQFMFYRAEVFNKPLDKWKVSNVNNMEGMFAGTKAFNQDIGKWDVSNVTGMRFMFDQAKAFNQNINDWTVSKLGNMEKMFYKAEVFNQPLNKWDVSNVRNMYAIFFGAKAFNQDLSDWKSPKTDKVTMCREFSTDARAWTKAKPTFKNCSK